MTIVATEDKRNQEWRKSNVGLKLLEKMGYKDGEGIGKRNTNNTALRALKRKEGLGLGAKIESEGGNSESTNHFSAVLTSLQAHHETTPTKKSKKKKSSKAKQPAAARVLEEPRRRACAPNEPLINVQLAAN